MKLKEQVLSVCGDKYQCLESVKVNGTEVITIGTEEEPYVLNFEIGDTAISVNVIDKCEGVVIDEYEDVYAEDTLSDCVSNAVMTYESIIKNKEGIKKVQENRALKDKFDSILADGSPELFGELTKEELIELNKYIDELEETPVAKKLAHFAVQMALDKIDENERKTVVAESFYFGDKVTVSGDDKVGELVEYLSEDPMDSLGCSSGNFGAWVVEYEDGTRQMADDDHLVLVEPGPRDKEEAPHYAEPLEESQSDSHPIKEDVNAISSRVDIPCEKDITLVAEITATKEGNYEADYIAGLEVGAEIELVLEDKKRKAVISNIYHDILTVKVDEEENAEYRVDTKHCDIDFSSKTFKFNAVKSNDIPGDWYAILKLKGSVEDIKKDVKIALNESASTTDEIGVSEGNADNGITDTETAETLDTLQNTNVMSLLYAVAEKLADLCANEEDEVSRKILDDISAETEQIITELSVVLEVE